MKQYRYNLDQKQAKHFANLKSGETMVIVVPLKRQPPKHIQWLIKPTLTGELEFFHPQISGSFTEIIKYPIIFPYPIGARVGLRETWDKWTDVDGVIHYVYKSSDGESVTVFLAGGGEFNIKWHSAQCMPVEAIDDRGNWVIAKDPKVDMVQNVTPQEIHDIGLVSSKELFINVTVEGFLEKDLPKRFKDWFNARYAPKWTWEMNVYVEILTVEKE
jgi:hypothetical protein